MKTALSGLVLACPPGEDVLAVAVAVVDVEVVGIGFPTAAAAASAASATAAVAAVAAAAAAAVDLQLMVAGVSGVSGAHATRPAEMENSTGSDSVTIHHHPTAACHALQEMALRPGDATMDAAQLIVCGRIGATTPHVQ
jgi:hypothetical protein